MYVHTYIRTFIQWTQLDTKLKGLTKSVILPEFHVTRTNRNIKGIAGPLSALMLTKISRKATYIVCVNRVPLYMVCVRIISLFILYTVYECIHV